MKNIPKEIYLNLRIPKRVFDITRNDIDFKELNGVSWSAEKIDDQDLKFVLSDVSNNEVALKAFVEEFVEAWDNGMGGDSSLYDAAKRLL